MDNERTDLLPPERQQALSREYFLRIAVVASLLISVLTAIAALLLLPTYLFLAQNAETKNTHLASIEAILSTADERALSAHLAALSSDASALLALGENASVSAIMQSALTISRPGVTLSGFVYAPAAGKLPGKLTITGVALTRDALRTYQLALQGAPFAIAADLPVSAYAKDADIGFTIIVTLAP